MAKELIEDKIFYCKDTEVELFAHCFIVKSRGISFDRKACGRGYKLHVIQNREEIKWVSGNGLHIHEFPKVKGQMIVEELSDQLTIFAAVFGDRHKELWIGNIGKAGVHLAPVRDPRPMFKGYAQHNFVSVT
ncbi:hypothetical protein COOONC_25907 [Cooperia oncophora]